MKNSEENNTEDANIKMLDSQVRPDTNMKALTAAHNIVILRELYLFTKLSQFTFIEERCVSELFFRCFFHITGIVSEP